MARARRARPGGGLLAIQDPDGLLAGTGMEEDATGGGFWADLRMEFISSTATLKELTERHPNVALGTLYNHSSREGWEEDRLLWRRNLHAATRTLVMHDQAGEMARAVQAIPLLANDLIQKMMQVVAMTPPQDMSIQDAMALGRVLGTLYQIMKTSVGGVAARPEPRTMITRTPSAMNAMRIQRRPPGWKRWSRGSDRSRRRCADSALRAFPASGRPVSPFCPFSSLASTRGSRSSGGWLSASVHP